VDATGNVWVADEGCAGLPCTPFGQVYEIINGTPSAVGSAWQHPFAITADGGGNVFVTDLGTDETGTVSEISGGVVTALNSTTYSNPFGIAVDTNDNLYVVDGSYIEELTAPGYSTSTIGGPFNIPAGLSIDPSGNLWLAEFGSGTVEEMLASANWTVETWGNGFNSPLDVGSDGNGNIFVTDSGGAAVMQISTGGINFGPSAIGTTSASSPLSIPFTFTTAGTVQAAVITQGASSADFADAGGSTCTGSVSTSCTVEVKFTPTASGTRYGAVELFSGSTVIASAHIYGVGTGPQITFGPGVPANLATSTTFTAPHGVAVDGSGNVYVADSSAAEVYRIPLGSATATALGSGFVNPTGVAVDGNGDVFVADPTGSAVKEILAVDGSIPATPTIVPLGGHTLGGVLFSFSAPSGTAVDGAGNVYVADIEAGAVEEILAASAYSVVTTLNSSFNSPESVAVDSSGNVYVADSGNNAVKEIVAVDGHVTSSSTISTLGGGFTFNSPQSVAVDGNGNVFISDLADVYEIPFGTSTVDTLVSGLSTSSGVAVDASGNVYYSNTGAAKVSELPLATPPTLTFAPQGDGISSAAQSVTILNDGNGATPLGAVSPGIVLSPSNFTLGDSSGDCTTTFSLLPGQSCNISVEFTPDASGPVTGTVTLTDNNLNASPSTTQQIPLTGTAIFISITSPVTLPDATDGSPYSVGPFTASPSSTYTWSATGLPTGLTMSSGGTLSGTPTETGVFTNVAVTATDTSSGFKGLTTFTLVVNQGPATMISPVPGSTLTSASTTFIWSANSSGVTGYYLWVGTTPGGLDLVNIGPLSGTSATVNLPTNGAPVYVRLWRVFNGTTFVYDDYTYTEATLAAAMASPTPGSTLASASTTFTWNAGSGNVTGYYLWAGTTPGGLDLANIGPLSGTGATVNLPTNGATVYVRLWTVFNGTTYLYNDYTYTEATLAAAMASPTPGSTLTSASTTFSWNAGPSGTTGYYLWAGTTLGGLDLANIGPLSGTSVTVNLPTNGATVYVRLWTVFNGTTYLYNDYTYTEATLAAAMASPMPGSTLTSASTTFTWNANSGGVTGYYFWAGTVPGGLDLVNIGPLSGTSVTVNLPTNGATVYVRLWTVFNGTAYRYNDYTYTEFQ
jgi:sugar lactone lactonase YvrE